MKKLSLSIPLSLICCLSLIAGKYDTDELGMACRKHDLLTIQQLLSDKTPITPEVVAAAVATEDTSLVKLLIDNGAPLNHPTILDMATATGSIDMVKFLLKNGVFATPDNIGMASIINQRIDYPEVSSNQQLKKNIKEILDLLIRSMTDISLHHN